MICSVMLYRNGGTAPGQTHICDDCFIVGLRHAKEFVDGALAGLGALVVHSEPSDAQSPASNGGGNA